MVLLLTTALVPAGLTGPCLQSRACGSLVLEPILLAQGNISDTGYILPLLAIFVQNGLCFSGIREINLLIYGQ
jgi:hypothetical protein